MPSNVHGEPRALLLRASASAVVLDGMPSVEPRSHFHSRSRDTTGLDIALHHSRVSRSYPLSTISTLASPIQIGVSKPGDHEIRLHAVGKTS